MKKNGILIIILGCLAMSLNAQEEQTYWDNGNVKTTIILDDNGEKTGTYKTFYENGELKEYGSYENGKKIGTWKEYYYDGTTKKVTRYYSGIIYRNEIYYDNGRLMVSGGFDDNGKKDGPWKQQYDNWQEKLEGNYSHGKKHGQWNYYTESGQLFKIENYKEDVRISKWENNDENSNTVVREDAVIDASNQIEQTEEEEIIEYVEVEEGAIETVAEAAGDAVEAASDATVESVNYYRNNRNGEWKFYNESGNVIEIGNYLNDRKYGKWTSYYDNGQIKRVQLWKAGKIVEVISYFDENGKTLDKGTLKAGKGTIKEYDANNKLVSTIEFVNGEEIDWNDAFELNNMAWDIYENETDAAILQKGIKMVKRSIELDKDYFNTDTYAALLFKTGNYKQALILAKEAIRIAKKNDDTYSSTTELIEQIHKKMKK
ncbi:hypothetical protein JBL43_13295 [Aureibaculum sp. A20]|uniref:Tetratricopeptide repeat protein n=1 Tax=Aureibaculum flavum TaxID=2795986 RepID=A0ABS0WTC5_9FLAO|nr:hypothetical protein [Aureibaculum flavum]MBJ2175222.1 hypothetical protein [Aureibaculum flavum]